MFLIELKMEKLQKLSLSLIIFAVLLCCNQEQQSKRELAEKRYKEAVWFTQGSIPFQNGIVEAIEIDPTYEQAVYELSVAHLKRGMPHKWLPQYNKAVQLDSVTRIPWRGYLYLWFYRDYKKAIADFDASDILTPNFVDAPQGLSVDAWRGIAYLGLKDYKTSIQYFDKYLKKEIEDFGEQYVDVTAFLYQGIAYLELKDYEKAEICFNKLIKNSYGFSADGKYYKALILFKQNKAEEAKIMIEAALKDFNDGYFNKRPYVETLRQLYLEDLTDLESSINSNNS
ncbi:Tetratricopeptide repeat protein [Tenacibaculum sp. 190130A14a]|uniref:Tetratricopeptide repeat protein n=2 Tax=Tenacibaculum polynesiense TaxID=3137857 RepID=A0ABP1EY42_9FLAO